jgi:hypothetical protein
VEPFAVRDAAAPYGLLAMGIKCFPASSSAERTLRCSIPGH